MESLDYLKFVTRDSLHDYARDVAYAFVCAPQTLRDRVAFLAGSACLASNMLLLSKEKIGHEIAAGIMDFLLEDNSNDPKKYIFGISEALTQGIFDACGVKYLLMKAEKYL